MKKHTIWLMMGLLLVAGLPLFGRTTASAQSGDQITRQNLNQLAVVATFDVRYAEDVAISSSGRLVAVAEGFGNIRVYDVQVPDEPLLDLEIPDIGVQTIDMSPDETLVAAGTTEGRIYIVDIRTGQTVATFEGHDAYVLDVAWSPDGNRLASAGDDSAILIWDVPSGQSPMRLEGHLDWVRSVAWSPDGDRIVSASDDTTALVWDTATGIMVNALAGHYDWVRSVDWSPNGSLIVTGSDDNLVNLWEAETGRLLLSLSGHNDYVRAVVVAPESDLVFSASDDSTVRAWEVTSSQPIATVLEGEFVQFLTMDISDEGNRIAIGSTDGSMSRVTVLGIQ